MKKVKIFIIAAFAFSITGCLKDKPNVDFSNIGAIAEISSSNINPTLNAPSSGLDYFSAATLPVFSVDTTCNCYLPFPVTFDVNITGQYPPAKDIAVKVAVDDTKRTAYNSMGGVKYLAAPDSIYKFDTTTAVIKAGSRLAKFNVIFYPAKIDPTQSYMLPITLTDASGLTISGNLGTIYLHLIGNVLAGSYNVTGKRTNFSGSSTTVTGTTNLANVKTASPVDATHISLDYGNVGGGTAYIIAYDPAVGLSSASATLTTAAFDTNGLTGYGIDSFTFNAPSRTFTIVSHYTNGSGNNRSITETFAHQ